MFVNSNLEPETVGSIFTNLVLLDFDIKYMPLQEKFNRPPKYQNIKLRICFIRIAYKGISNERYLFKKIKEKNVNYVTFE